MVGQGALGAQFSQALGVDLGSFLEKAVPWLNPAR